MYFLKSDLNECMTFEKVIAKLCFNTFNVNIKTREASCRSVIFGPYPVGSYPLLSDWLLNTEARLV